MEAQGIRCDCWNCGESIAPGATLCRHCGVSALGDVWPSACVDDRQAYLVAKALASEFTVDFAAARTALVSAAVAAANTAPAASSSAFCDAVSVARISAMVGGLYSAEDARRNAGYAIYYMGINLGALFGGPVGEYMRMTFGWPLAFATAGGCMAFSLVTFAFLRKHVTFGDNRSSVAAVFDMPLPAEYEDRPDPPAVERQRIIALVVMCLIVMFFWMAFHQNGTSLTFWARDNTDRVLRIGSWSKEIPPGVFQAFNSAFIIILTPVLVRVMSWLRARNWEPNTPTKIGIGMLLTGLSYAILVVASWSGGDHGKVGMGWLIGCYFVITIAELLLSPMGLSMVTKLAPRRMTAMLMGVWFIATAVGNYLSGFIGRFWRPWKHSEFFMLLVVTSLLAACLLLWQYRRLKLAMPPQDPLEDEKKQTSSESAVPELAGAGC